MDDAFSRPIHFDPSGAEADPDQRKVLDPSAVTNALRGTERLDTVVVDATPYRVFTMPLRHGGCIQVARNISDLEELASVQNQTLIIFVPLAALFGVFSAFGLRRMILRPISELSNAAARVSADRLGERLEVAGDDELAQMGNQFNAMLARLESAFERERRFSADASHELRTPLARIVLATTRALQEGTSEADARKALEIASSSAKEMSGLVEQLLTLAKADADKLTPNLETVDARILLAEAVDEFDNVKRLELKVPDSPLTARVDPAMAKRAVRNLIANAIRHTNPNQNVTVSGAVAQGRLRIIVQDEGDGISAEHLAHLGERFYRPDSARNAATGGAGLGLAIVRAIMKSHGGELAIQGTLGKGTTAQLDFPLLIESK